MPDDAFDIVDKYDAIDDPALRPEFLDALGRTRVPMSQVHRRRRTPNESAAPVRDMESERHHAPRAPRRPRTAAPTRPPYKDRTLRRYRGTPAPALALEAD
ncbi:hypothetical protein [Streptomyces sp. NPDC059744]|uniref:hypothetical protein n=1 Tax=Streptomyces sp. NPDC059744 TaxID=3346929 RepID=UPI0036565E95